MGPRSARGAASPFPDSQKRWRSVRRWCATARDWQAAEARIARFCAEPLTARNERAGLFPVTPGALSGEDLRATQSRIAR